MHDTIMLLVAALAFAAVARFVRRQVRERQNARRSWLAIGALSLLLSAASWFVTDLNRVGTLLQRRHGWPKIYSYEFLSLECTSRGPGIDLIFFLGNSFFYAAVLIFGWTLINLFARRR